MYCAGSAFYFASVCVVAAALIYLNTVTNPALSGKLELPGLSGPVTVTRDRWGVPHIVAEKSDADAVEALGFVHGQDRLWQMEFQRRVAQGRLSEVLGKPHWTRTNSCEPGALTGPPRASPGPLAAQPRADRAYTRGVNAAIDQNRLPLEFRILASSPNPGRISTAWRGANCWPTTRRQLGR